MTDGLQILGGDWYLAVPPPAVPVPAAHVPDLPGRRAIETCPGTGIITGLRIYSTDDPATCTVVTELDYWRARIVPGGPVPTRRVPVDRLHVEHRLPYEPPPVGEQPEAGADQFGIFRRIAPAPDSPAARTPVPARDVRNLHGRRLVQVAPTGFAWDLRAVSEPYDQDGEVTANVTSAHDYYRWVITGEPPR
ncbi:hypothetical protein [Streptomyces sp. Ac-502]|uniref:hypothetical protein n=1 Tax=Streptomyces sp. Ac-502 TaxID=3342801 RepID=UPI0038629AAD